MSAIQKQIKTYINSHQSTHYFSLNFPVRHRKPLVKISAININMAEGPHKEYLKLEIHQLIVKAEYGTAVLGNHIPNFIPHVDQANQFPSPTYKNHAMSTITLMMI